MALAYTTITGSGPYFKDGSGNPLSGTVTFTPSQNVYASGVPVVSTANPVVVPVTSGVLGAVSLLATDNAGLSFLSQTGYFTWLVQVTLGNLPQAPWSFFLPSSPSTVDLYKLANTPAGGSGGITPPAGDIGGTTSAPTVVSTHLASPLPVAQGGTGQTTQQAALDALAGAQTAAQVLAGNGSHVTLRALAAADLAATANQAGYTPLLLNPAVGLVWGYPWKFSPFSYGAKGNGTLVPDVVTNGTTTVTSASGGFASAVAGQYIQIHGANGSAAGPLITTIATVSSATSVTLSAAAGASVSNCPAIFGTDDVAKINLAMSALGTYALADNYDGILELDPFFFILGAGPTQTGNGSTTPTFNSQIPLPYPAADGHSQKLILQIESTGDAGWEGYWESSIPSVAGASLVSMLVGPNSPDATFGRQSVVGGPTSGAGFTSGLGQAFANVKVVVKGVSIWQPLLTNTRAWDLGFVSAARAQQSNAMIFAPPGSDSKGVQPYLKNLPGTLNVGNTISVGWTMPVNQNNTDVTMDDCACQGSAWAFSVADWLAAGHLHGSFCDSILVVNQGGGIGHLIAVQQMDAEGYNQGLRTNGGGSQTTAVDIGWSAECGSVTWDVNDSGNYLHGEFRFQDPADAGRGISVNGAANLKIINNQLGPGPIASPTAPPANNAAWTNSYYRDAEVTLSVSGGTLTALKTDAVSEFLPASCTLYKFTVPGGHTYTPTFTGTLTHTVKLS